MLTLATGLLAAQAAVPLEKETSLWASPDLLARHNAMGFNEWRSGLGKAYKTTEETRHRRKVFEANQRRINEHNAQPGHSHKLRLNAFADLEPHEFKARFTGYRRRDAVKKTLRGEAAPATSDVPEPSSSASDKPKPLPKEVDWVSKGAVAPVKNQLQCGSCWAFSAVAAMEGLHFIKKGELLSLSEQQLVDCSGAFGDMGCMGGLMDNAFKYVAATGGLCTEESYPYTGVDGTCEASQCKKAVQINGHSEVAPNDGKALMTALAKQPVSVAIEADEASFQFYSHGVMTGSCHDNLDHGVLAVGYGVDKATGLAYWKIKNSWGANWGENGYIRLGRDDGTGKQKYEASGQCGILSAASFPTA